MLEDPFSRRFPLLAFARNNLSRARARTILAMAGITIGVLAIASLGMFGAAFEQSILDTSQDFTQTVQISPGEDAEFDVMRRDQIDEIEQYTSHPVHPIQQGGGTFSAKNSQVEGSIISMDEPGVFVSTTEGEIPPNWRSGALVGATVAEDLDVTVGDSVVVSDTRHRVVGILEEDAQGAFVQTDDAVLLPTEQSPMTGYSMALVRADSPTEAFAAAEELRASLNPGRLERYTIFDAEAAIEQFNQQLALINTFLIGIGAVSLLVASVSILNVMLMSTIERKAEIGVLRATGFHRLDVLRLMLNEAALLGMVGAFFGVILSILLGMLINAQLLGDPMAFTAAALQYVAIGFLFGTLASFLSGLYPAWKAANARPVEALRD